MPLDCGMVLVFSMWDDIATSMNWLDSYMTWTAILLSQDALVDHATLPMACPRLSARLTETPHTP